MPAGEPTPFNVRLFPSLRGYHAAALAGDALAGIVLAAIAIPEQLAVAKLAGFPLDAGLYAFAAGTLAFAVFGTNRFVSAGADSTIAPIFVASLGMLAAAGSPSYRDLAGVLALFAGALLVAAGVARAGWIADLLSVPVTTGFLAGIAFHIIVGQLPSLLGVAEPAGPVLRRAGLIVAHAGGTNPFACALGSAVILVTIGAERLNRRLPGALIGLAAAGFAVAVFHLSAHGVVVLGALSAGVPALRFPPLHGLPELVAIAPLALVVAAVCALQTALVVRSFPSQPDATEDAADDFMAIGLGNILAALGGTFAVNASPPRTAVVRGAGGRTQMSGLVAVACVAASVAFAGRFAADVPQAALAGVLIVIGLRIVRWRDMRRIARLSRREIQLVIAGALLVIVLPIQTGMLLAIMLSLAHGVSLVMWPPSTQLFAVRGTTIWWPPSGELEVVDVPGIVVFAPAAPVNFTNAQYIRERLLTLVARAPAPVELVVIEASAMSDVDYTGSLMLQTLIGELRGRAIEVALARLIGPHAQAAAERSGLSGAIGKDRIFLSVHDAVAALHGSAT